MILKGNQRANGGDLAVHLMNEFDNERVHVAQVRGAVASDLKGAFAEFEAVAMGTKCTQPLYSLSINPSQPISRSQYDEAIEAIEQKLGLSGQPRVVVFHEKYGRAHAHVVWSRIRVDTMRAIPMSHDHRKLCDLACDLAHRFGHELPPGLKAWEKKERFEKQKIDPTLAERAQAQKSGITPDKRCAQITALYEQADMGIAVIPESIQGRTVRDLRERPLRLDISLIGRHALGQRGSAIPFFTCYVVHANAEACHRE